MPEQPDPSKPELYYESKYQQLFETLAKALVRQDELLKKQLQYQASFELTLDELNDELKAGFELKHTLLEQQTENLQYIRALILSQQSPKHYSTTAANPPAQTPDTGDPQSPAQTPDMGDLQSSAPQEPNVPPRAPSSQSFASSQKQPPYAGLQRDDETAAQQLEHEAGMHLARAESARARAQAMRAQAMRVLGPAHVGTTQYDGLEVLRSAPPRPFGVDVK